MKINDLVQNNKLIVFGYPAFKGLEALSNPDGNEVVLSALPAGVVLDAGYSEFFAPVQTRNVSYGSAEEILDDNLPVVKYHAHYQALDDIKRDGEIIVSRHKAAVDMLRAKFPHLKEAPVITGNVTLDEVRGKVVYGTLPTGIAAEAAAMVSVTIPGYDFKTMSDLSSDELLARGLEMVIKEPAVISVI